MNNNGRDLTIVVPTLNEAGNVEPLTRRIDTSMRRANIPYSILFIDDHSNDGTTDRIHALSHSYPVSFQMKDGERGKAQSVIQGFNAARSNFVCMIDADLQYPPEDISKMVDKLIDHDADVALSQRSDSDAGKLRNVMSSIFNFVFVRSLFGINYDTQSGLKVFRRHTYDGMNLQPSQWSFDLEFIVAALQKQSRILTHDIKFGKRTSGDAKVDVIKSSIELAKSSVLLRMRVSGKRIRQAYNLNMARYTGVTGTK
jgi:dolichol-phosphate mannosyltransferase